MERVPPVLVVVSLVLAGCAAVPGDGTVSPTSSNTRCVEDVSFWGLAGPSSADLWARDRVRIGYTLPPASDALFVVYENDTVLGWAHVRNGDPEYPIASDGDVIELDTELHGTHAIRVVTYRDANGDGAFDPKTDEPCTEDGDVVATDTKTIDFDRFAHNGTSTTTP